MKNFKVFTVAMFLMTATATTFTSCGGGEAATEEKAADVKLDNGLGYVKQVVLAFEAGDVKMDKATPKEIASFFKVDEDEEYLFGDNEFTGYRLDRSYSISEGVINSVSYSTFYDDDKKDAATKDSKEILAFLEGKFGKSKSTSEKYFDWEKKDYNISFNIFDDGYSLYIESHVEPVYPEDETELGGDDNCVGDFYTLKQDLTDKFFANIKNGKIKLGTTTKANMTTLVGSADSYKMEYDGLRVSGYFTFEGDKLSAISLDYFYDCTGALSLLDMDKADISAAADATLGVVGKKDGDYENAGTTWIVGNTKVRQANFSDGYSVYIDKK